MKPQRKLLGYVVTLSAICFLFGMFGGVAACGGSYAPVQDGQCHQGRKWVPPAKDASGNWKAGYCTDQ